MLQERKKQESLSGGRDGPGDLPEPIRLQISKLEVQNNQLKEIYSNVSEKLAAAEQVSFVKKNCNLYRNNLFIFSCDFRFDNLLTN